MTSTRFWLNQATTEAEAARVATKEANRQTDKARQEAAEERAATTNALWAKKKLKKENEEITARSKELLFQMALKDTKFRATIAQMKKSFPGQDEAIDHIVKAVDHQYDSEAAKEWREEKKVQTDALHDQIENMADLHQAIHVLKNPKLKN